MTGFEHLSGKFVKVSTPAPHVALVELARQPLNSFTPEFWVEYGEVFDKLSLEPEVRVIVLASALPKLFAAGIDFQALTPSPGAHPDVGRRAIQLRHHIKGFQDSISAPSRCPYPVIAAVHGHTIGLGIDIISACDVRLAAADAKLSIKEVDVGLAADIGTLARVPKVVGNQSLVYEVALTGRSFSAVEAEKMGFVSKVVPGSRDEVVREALEMAKLIAKKSPVAVVGTKRVLQHARENTVEDNLEYVAIWNASMVQAADVQISVDAAKAKKSGTFPSLGKYPAKL